MWYLLSPKEDSSRSTVKDSKDDLNLLPFDLPVTYTKGEEMLLADPLSRETTDTPTQAMEDDVLIYDIKEMPRTSDRRLEELIEETKKDNEMQELKAVVQQGWPDERKYTSPIVQSYWNIRDKIS